MGVQHTRIHVYVRACVRVCVCVIDIAIIGAKISCRCPSVATVGFTGIHTDS